VCIHRLKKLARLRDEKKILAFVSTHGIPRSQVEEIPLELDRKPRKGVNYYYYMGPLDDRTRPFCRKMLEIDKVFSESEISKLSSYLNYDVLDKNKDFGPGAFNCRHSWVRFRGKEISTAPPTVKQINDLIRSGIRVK
jgi:hypothetical protein